MNRTLLFSIVGLGALSAAGFAGSQGANASVVTCTSTSRQAPVVLVTQPDGQRATTHCVSVAASDPASPVQSGPSTFTFTTQGRGGSGTNSLDARGAGSPGARGTGAASGVGVNALMPHSGAVSSSNGGGGGVGFGAFSSTGSSPSSARGGSASCASPSGVSAGFGSALGGGVCSATPNSEPSACSTPCEEPASVTVNSQPNNLFARIHSTQGQAPIAIEYGDAFERVIYTEPAEAAEVAEVDSEPWGEKVERAFFEVARERASKNQEDAREVWQRAAEEAREAQERAREAYADAMENYREAMRAAEERTRSTAERVVAERRAQADRKSWSQRSNARGSNAQGRDAELASRIDKLEAAARARGVHVADGDRSLEERVAQLEELTTEQQRARSSKLFTRMAPSTPPPTPRVFRLRRSNELAPSAPMPPTPPVEAAQPPPAASPFWLGAAPMAPVPPMAPAQGAPRNEDRARMEKAMTEMKRDAARLREELDRMRAQIEGLPREDGSR